jgi:hypothetical protein
MEKGKGRVRMLVFGIGTSVLPRMEVVPSAEVVMGVV